MWIGGAGQLPGEAFMRKGNPESWLWVHVPGTDFGRIVRIDVVVDSQLRTWAELKTLYR